MGGLFILLGVALVASEVMSLFELLKPEWTPGSLLLASFLPPGGVHVITIGGGLGIICLGIILVNAMLLKRHQAERGLIDGYGRAEEEDGG